MGAWIEIPRKSETTPNKDGVAPLVGAWIEIPRKSETTPNKDGVAPLVGAWIEIARSFIISTTCPVAPLVGAWIEINNPPINLMINMSLLSWERGLK